MPAHGPSLDILSGKVCHFCNFVLNAMEERLGKPLEQRSGMPARLTYATSMLASRQRVLPSVKPF
jgi:hypothetical protein